VKLPEDAEKIGEGTAKTVHGPRGHHVELAAGNRLEQGVEPRPSVAASSAGYSLVLVDASDGPSASFSSGLQFAALVPCVLFHAIKAAIALAGRGLVFLLFDLMFLDCKDLRAAPLEERRPALPGCNCRGEPLKASVNKACARPSEIEEFS
jgi:hypothetical protein